MPLLHVNIDHVATLRQARREAFPDPTRWALAALAAGADGITFHLRKDRRHIQDADVSSLRAATQALLNLESSLDPEILEIARTSGAQAFCLVPENRQEVTTEGGLDVLGERARLADAVPMLTEAGGAVSLFVDPEPRQLDASRELQAPFVELHTGAYARAASRGDQAATAAELQRLVSACQHARSIGLRVNAGHGLDYDNVAPVARMEGVEELNVGFAIVARAVFAGVDAAIRDMKRAIDAGTTPGTD